MQPVDYPAIQKVLLDNLGNVRRAHLGIPDAIGIDQYRRADSAKTNRGALGHHDAPFGIFPLRFFAKQNAARFKFAFKGLSNIRAAHGRTGFAGTDKKRDAGWAR